MPLHFSFKTKNGAPAVRDAAVGDLVIAGWTGRDEEAMEKHIAELEAIGVPRPPATPCFYRVAADQLTQAASIDVVGGDTSGEIEFFVFQADGERWLGTGSDHTDRKLEAHNVTQSKQVCAKPIARTLWRFDDVMDHWDKLILRSFATIDGRRAPYQEGPVTTMRAPDDLIARYQAEGGAFDDGTMMFCGTLAVIGGVRPSSRFEIEMYDPVMDRTIQHAYDIQTLPNIG